QCERHGKGLCFPRLAKNRASRVARKTGHGVRQDRKSTRLNSSHSQISYAVFCLKKKSDSRRPVLADRRALLLLHAHFPHLLLLRMPEVLRAVPAVSASPVPARSRLLAVSVPVRR